MSLLVALVCLSAPELAHQLMSDALLVESGGSGNPGSGSSVERTRVALRSLPECLKVVRQSSAYALGQWTLAEATVASGSPLVELEYRPGSPTPAPPSRGRVFALFERPPPAA